MTSVSAAHYRNNNKTHGVKKSGITNELSGEREGGRERKRERDREKEREMRERETRGGGKRGECWKVKKGRERMKTPIREGACR